MVPTPVSSYASHSFVIDCEEAADIFNHVDEAKGDFEELRKILGDVGLMPISASGELMLAYLNKEVPNEPGNKAPIDGKQPEVEVGPGQAAGVPAEIHVGNLGEATGAQDAAPVGQPGNFAP